MVANGDPAPDLDTGQMKRTSEEEEEDVSLDSGSGSRSLERRGRPENGLAARCCNTTTGTGTGYERTRAASRHCMLMCMHVCVSVCGTCGGLDTGAAEEQCGVNCGTQGDTLLSSRSFTEASVSSISLRRFVSGSAGSAAAALGRSSFRATMVCTPSWDSMKESCCCRSHLLASSARKRRDFSFDVA